MTTILTTRVDGVLVAPAGDPSLPHLNSLRKHNVPFVLLDREVPGIDCDIVLGDSRDGARRLVEHLASQGHSTIAMVNGSSSISSARLRLQGYQDGMKLNDLEYNEKYVFETSFGPLNDLTEMGQWFDQLSPPPTAIVAGNNVLAVEILRLFRERGMSVPDNMSIVCFDDLGPYSEVEPFLTVAAQQAYQFGYMGMQMLVDRIQEREAALPWKKSFCRQS